MLFVCALADLPAGEGRRIDADVPIAVFNVDGELYAIDDECSHQEASLSDGWVDGCHVECPVHSSLFDLRTGRPCGLPATEPVRVHRVHVADGLVYVQPSADRAPSETV